MLGCVGDVKGCILLDNEGQRLIAKYYNAAPGTPFETTQQQHAASKLHRGMKQLPSEQSTVLNKVYMEGKTHQEAAAELQLPLGTIKSRIRLALQKLHIALKS